jgi:formamidopyrimidine-DNA glycosylase
MPELPEVETIRRSLDRRLVGRRISGCRVLHGHVLQGCRPADLRRLQGLKVTELGRRGKYLIIALENGTRLVFHLKMTGQFLLGPAARPRDRHTHIILRFTGWGQDLRFRDVRKFGRLRLDRGKAGGQDGAFQGLGPEPLQVGLDEFARLIRRRTGRMKSLLLDQGFLAGIGNIYADEILFAARLHPLASAARLSPEKIRRLWRSLRRILRRAVARGGSTIRDYQDAQGRVGLFQLEHKAYGRASLPCRRCGRPISRMVIGGRSTHFCARCQTS